MKLSVVIPVYNEKDTIAEIYRLVKSVKVAQEIILVDDFSTDGTREIIAALAEEATKVILHDRNMGKGAALRTGFQRRPEISSLFRTPIWSMTPISIQN